MTETWKTLVLEKTGAESSNPTMLNHVGIASGVSAAMKNAG